MIDSSIPQSIQDAILQPTGVVDAEPVAPGMSGAAVYHCRFASGEQAALKRWAEGSSLTRVLEVHRVMRRAREGGCRFVPRLHDWPQAPGDPSTALRHGPAVWELTEWLEGRPAGAEASLDVVRTGAAAIAEFHSAVAREAVVHQPAPAVRTRLKRLDQLERILGPAIEGADRVQLHPDLADAVQAASRCFRLRWHEIQARIRASLVPHAQQPVATQYVLRDVHRGHLLWRAGQVTGLIDYDAVRVDTTATDLARWAGSFVGGPHDEDEIWDAALAGFFGQNTLSRSTHQDGPSPMLARNLCFATTWISLANWLVWIVCENRAFDAGPQAVSQRIRELMQAIGKPT